MNVADRIYELRKEKGMSQEELANELGVSRQAVSKWESEKSTPDIENISELCNLFEVSANYLLNGEEPVKKACDISRIFFYAGTFFNMAGLVILMFNLFLTWEKEPDLMSSKDVVIKVIIIILMILGTTFFILSEKKIKYKKIRKFLIINSFAYSGLLSMICYLAGVPGRFWALTIYASVLFVSEVLLMKIK